MKKNAEVDRWFKDQKPPAEKAMQQVREIILGADPRVAEYIKYGNLVFGYESDLASFVQHRAKTVSLMFHRGARIKGKFPHLEGTHASARFMRFGDEKEVSARAKELAQVVKAWCAMAPAERGNK